MARLSLDTARWYAAESELNGRQSRRIGHNTSLERRGPDAIGIRYHATDIVTVTRDGWAIIDRDGWDSVTTNQRVNALLPYPWHVGSGSLWQAGTEVLPYADGLAVHVGTTERDATGAVGFSTDRRTVAPMLSAAEVQTIIDTAHAAQAARAEKRAARLLREHPVAGTPHAHKGFEHSGQYQRRPRGCERCEAELAAIRDAIREAFRVEHAALVATLARNPDAANPWTEAEYAAAGQHVRREETRTYPERANPAYPGQSDYNATPVIGEKVTIACPWQCPETHIGRGY